MKHVGTLFLGRARPVTDTNADGDFRLSLVLIDNLGGGRVEGYRVHWAGPDARAFWDAHRAELVAGAVVDAELSHLRQHMGTARPPMPELHARVVRLRLLPKAAPAPAANHFPAQHATA